MGCRATLLPPLQTKLEGNGEFGGVSALDKLSWCRGVPSSDAVPPHAGPKDPVDPPIPTPTGDCLLDQPAKPIPLPEDLPGTSYSLNQQCELAFGVGSKPCPYMQYCAKLWCTGKARGQIVCQTRHFPWADGTGCGEGRFCLKGACVERHNISKYRVSTCAVSPPPKKTSRGGHLEFLRGRWLSSPPACWCRGPGAGGTPMGKEMEVVWVLRISARGMPLLCSGQLWAGLGRRCFACEGMGSESREPPPPPPTPFGMELVPKGMQHLTPPHPRRWTAAGRSGHPTGSARGRAAVGCSWPSGSAPTRCLPTGVPTARASASSTAPATWTPALLQVRGRSSACWWLCVRGRYNTTIKPAPEVWG